MKVNLLVLSLLLAVAVHSLTDKEVLQQAFNGLFEQNKLPDPSTVVQCFDDASAHSTVVFVGTLLDKAAKGSISDLIGLKDLVEKFGDSLPKAVKDCLGVNSELQKLGEKYGINNKTDPSTIEKKIISYVTLHYLTVHKWIGGLDSSWKAGKYYDVGRDAATYGHTILGMETMSPELSDKEILQQFLNGLFETNKLPDPTTVVPCFDDASAHSTVKFIGELLHKAAKGSVSDLIGLKDLVQKFSDSLPKAVKDCLNGNAEFEALGVKYGITNTTDTSKLEKKVIAYVTTHYLSVHKSLGEWDKSWSEGKYSAVGVSMAKFGHQVLGNEAKAIGVLQGFKKSVSRRIRPLVEQLLN